MWSAHIWNTVTACPLHRLGCQVTTELPRASKKIHISKKTQRTDLGLPTVLPRKGIYKTLCGHCFIK